MTRSESLKADARKLRDAIFGKIETLKKYKFFSIAIDTCYGPIPCRFDVLRTDQHPQYQYSIECDIYPNQKFDFYDSADTARKEKLTKILVGIVTKYLKKYWVSIGPRVLKICIQDVNSSRDKETLLALEAILDFMGQEDIFIPISGAE